MKRSSKLLAVAGLLGVVVGLAFVVQSLEAPPSTVRDVVWDKQVCRECGMSVSERHFACQLQIADGNIHDFDDPGCLFQYVLREKPSVHAMFFRAMEGDEWIPQDNVGFVPTDRSPMDYGLGAVASDRHTGAMTFEQAVDHFQRIHLEKHSGEN